MMRDFSYRRSTPWTYAEIVRKTGPVSYEVQSDNKTYRRHADQLTSTQATGRVTPPPIDFNDEITDNRNTALDPPTNNSHGPTSDEQQPKQHMSVGNGSTGHACEPRQTILRRSTRAQKSVQRYGESIPWAAMKK